MELHDWDFVLPLVTYLTKAFPILPPQKQAHSLKFKYDKKGNVSKQLNNQEKPHIH